MANEIERSGHSEWEERRQAEAAEQRENMRLYGMPDPPIATEEVFDGTLAEFVEANPDFISSVMRRKARR
jgi:hypothetical protein